MMAGSVGGFGMCVSLSRGPGGGWRKLFSDRLGWLGVCACECVCWGSGLLVLVGGGSCVCSPPIFGRCVVWCGWRGDGVGAVVPVVYRPWSWLRDGAEAGGMFIGVPSNCIAVT